MDPPIEERGGSVKNKRHWTFEEDCVLVETLLDMVNLGLFKGDNGFRPGHLNWLKEKLCISLPGHGIKGKPHIESRMKTLKKDYNAVHEMLTSPNISGFGWDPTRNMVYAEPFVWDAYVQVKKNAAVWKTKSFAHYESCRTIFGRERATGQSAQTAADMLDDLEMEKNNSQEAFNEEMFVGDGIENISSTHMNFTSNDDVSQVSSKKRKKQRNDDKVEALANAARILGNDIKEASELFNKTMVVDLAMSDHRKMLYEEMSKIKNLNMSEQLLAASKIYTNRDHIEFFFSLPDEAKEEWVKLLMAGKI